MILALILLALSIACYSVSQLQQHGKLHWQSLSKMYSFWGEWSDLRKYKRDHDPTGVVHYLRVVAPDNWYYRFFKIKYKERFPLSATFLVSITDSYHALQSLSFLSMAGSIYLFSGINFFAIWLGILFINFIIYKLLSK